jgi:hypothetical protein
MTPICRGVRIKWEKYLKQGRNSSVDVSYFFLLPVILILLPQSGNYSHVVLKFLVGREQHILPSFSQTFSLAGFLAVIPEAVIPSFLIRSSNRSLD